MILQAKKTQKVGNFFGEMPIIKSGPEIHGRDFKKILRFPDSEKKEEHMISAGDGVAGVTVRIPAGEYECRTVPAFRIDQSEMTNGFATDVYYEAAGIGWFERITGWGLFGRTPKAKRFSLPEKRKGFDGDNQPLVDVTGRQAKAICEARGMKLPTPTEWKYAAGGPNHFRFSTRDGQFDRVGIYSSVDWTRETIRDAGSGKGHYVQWEEVELYDMSGSIDEWTYDPASGEYYLCGGSWSSAHEDHLRSDYCQATYPDLYPDYEDL